MEKYGQNMAGGEYEDFMDAVRKFSKIYEFLAFGTFFSLFDSKISRPSSSFGQWVLISAGSQISKIGKKRLS